MTPDQRAAMCVGRRWGSADYWQPPSRDQTFVGGTQAATQDRRALQPYQDLPERRKKTSTYRICLFKRGRPHRTSDHQVFADLMAILMAGGQRSITGIHIRRNGPAWSRQIVWKRHLRRSSGADCYNGSGCRDRALETRNPRIVRSISRCTLPPEILPDTVPLPLFVNPHS